MTNHLMSYIGSDGREYSVTSSAGIPISSAPQVSQTYNVAGVIAINTVLLTVDCSLLEGVSIQCTSMGTTGVVTPEWSNDGATWVGATITPVAGGAGVTTISAAGQWVTNVFGRYLRLRLSTATTAGTTTFAVQGMPTLANLPVPLQAAVLTAGSAMAADIGIQYRANTTGTGTPVSVMSPATPAAATIKSSTGRLIGFYLQNSAAALRSVKVFNIVSPTLGTSTATFEIDLAANASVYVAFEGGIGFSTAMTYSVTSAKGLTDNTATGLALGDVSGFFVYG